tara:strand:- start:3050 stop:3265 length:216 start_codon:yes stop_codon:yes gene_type:complete
METAFTGAVMSVSKVPSLRSSAIVLMVRNGIKAGAPKSNPSDKEDKGGRIQFVPVKLSIKKRKPTPSNAKK